MNVCTYVDLDVQLENVCDEIEGVEEEIRWREAGGLECTPEVQELDQLRAYEKDLRDQLGLDEDD